MRVPRVLALTVLVAGALLVGASPARAGATDRAVVLTVGPEKLSVGGIEQRLNAVPVFQLRTFGKTADEVRKAFVQRVLVPELLQEQEAMREHLERVPRVRDRVREVLRDALHRALQAQLARQEPVADAAVKAYYEAHKSQYNTPESLRLWRILVASKAQAEKILEQVRGRRSIGHWMSLCGRLSLDKSTALQNGDLGFVKPDGTTDRPALKADPALFAAANKVKDGALVPEPVREGSKWAVVWRRGSLPPTHHKLAEEDHAIRNVLFQREVMQATKDLIAQLRVQHVREVNAGLLDYLSIDDSADITAKARPGRLQRGAAGASARKARARAKAEP